MSGGSYDYMYIKEPDELLQPRYQEQMEHMAIRLAELGFNDASQETFMALYAIRQFENRMRALSGRMAGVWQAVEWYTSCDWGLEDVQKAVDKYRGETKS